MTRKEKSAPGALFLRSSSPSAACAVSHGSSSVPANAAYGSPSSSRQNATADFAVFSPSGTGGVYSSFAHDGNGLPLKETTVVTNHITNTKAVVTLVCVEYSDAMRGYRVCRQNQIDAPHRTSPLLRLVTANDLVLLALVIVLALPFIIKSSNSFYSGGTVPMSAAVGVLGWLRHATAHNNALEVGRRHLEAAFTVKVRLGFLLVFAGALLFRLWSAYVRVYVEEVLAIRGIGLQVTSYGVFSEVRSRRFIDMKLLHSLVIHDTFFRYQPIFFLSSSVENRPERLVYFLDTLPRLAVLQPVLVGLRHVLYGEEELGLTLAEQEQQQALAAERSQDDYPRSEESGADDTTVNAAEEMELSGVTAASDDETAWQRE